MTAKLPEQIVNTTCASHCGSTCRLKVHVRGGVITRIENVEGEEPQLRGCLRGRAYRQRVYAPDRLKYPLKRVGKRGEGKFERISWDEALDTVARELVRVRDTYGPASILKYSLGGDLGQLHTARLTGKLLGRLGGFTSSWGTPSYHAALSASDITYGTLVTGNTPDNLLKSRLIIFWAWNPMATIHGSNLPWFLTQARDAGAKMVAIDPRYTDSAAFAGRWIPIRPGTDTAMLIAMAYVMISENLHDQAYLDKYTVGFEKFRDYVMGKEDGQPKTPKWAEAITGVPAATIASLAREFATTKPAAFMAGISPGRTAFGEQYHRAAITLAAMTGNVGVDGGDAAARVWESKTFGMRFRLKMGNGGIDEKNPVDDRAPAPPPGAPYNYRASRIHICDIPDFILRGKAGGYPTDCKALFVVNSNYVNQTPNLNKIVQGLMKLEFMAVQEQFMTATAKFADIVLPTTTFLERNDIDMGASLQFYGYVKKAIEPVGECKSHLEIADELARRLGVPWEKKTEAEWLREMTENSEIGNFDSFKDKGMFWVRREPDIVFKKQIQDPANNPFPTPSGKIEIYSQRWADRKDPKLPPIPKYIETWESRNDPLMAKYPLQLITTHLRRRANNQYDNIPWLRETDPQAALMNAADAAARGIKNGDPVRVFNDRGEMRIPARVTQRMMPGVVDVPQGAWYEPDAVGIDRGGCANVLTSEVYSPAGGLAYNTALVQVEKVDQQKHQEAHLA